MKLGKLAPKNDPRTLKLAHYLNATFAARPTPPVQDWARAVKAWPMYRNDEIGCCAIATMAHQLRAWSVNDGRGVEVAEDQVVAEYSAVSGFRPGDPATDVGCYMLDVLNRFRKVGLFGKRIGAYASVSTLNPALTKQAIWLFGGVLVGLALPLAVQGATAWRLPRLPFLRGEWAKGSWGGHAVPVVKYDERGLTCVTWGGLVEMDWQFYQTYCDEAYAAIAAEWVGPDSTAPNGFNALQLTKDLRGLN